MIKRILENKIRHRFFSGKTIVLVGARQVGKTTLIKKLLNDKAYLFLDGDESLTRNMLNQPTRKELESIIGGNKIVFIDEAQRIDNIGLTAKIINDQFKNVQLILSGSSSFQLTNRTAEPLTGRKWEFHLYPIAWQELENAGNYIETLGDLNIRLIYGFYPDVISNRGDERAILTELTESYLFRDLMAFSGIRKPEILEKLLKALAFQVGNEISYNELAQLIGVDKNTVANYIQILIMSYVIFPLHSFSRNLRNEIKRNQKIYFYDNGIRNALIQNFNPIDFRNDIGALWENFLITERMKRNHYFNQYTNSYFWRTHTQQEIDYVEERDGKVMGYEFKWNPKSKVTTPHSFIQTYKAEFKIIHRENFRDFIIHPYSDEK